MSNYSLNEREKSLLYLIREAESRGTPNDYTAVYTATDPDLTTRTLTEVTAKNQNGDYIYPVLGAYNLEPTTVEALQTQLSLPESTQFTEATQDYLALQVVKSLGYDSWINGSLSGGDSTFQERLSAVFIHVPNTGDGLSNFETELATAEAGFDEGQVDPQLLVAATEYTTTNFQNNLKAIRVSEPGDSLEVSVNPRPPEPANPGNANTGVTPPGSPRPANVSGILPSSAPIRDPSDPYLYLPLVFGNNRYDFRTGKKVNLIPVVQRYGQPTSSVTIPPVSRSESETTQPVTTNEEALKELQNAGLFGDVTYQPVMTNEEALKELQDAGLFGDIN